MYRNIVKKISLLIGIVLLPLVFANAAGYPSGSGTLTSTGYGDWYINAPGPGAITIDPTNGNANQDISVFDISNSSASSAAVEVESLSIAIINYDVHVESTSGSGSATNYSVRVFTCSPYDYYCWWPTEVASDEYVTNTYYMPGSDDNFGFRKISVRLDNVITINPGGRTYAVLSTDIAYPSNYTSPYSGGIHSYVTDIGMTPPQGWTFNTNSAYTSVN